ncbi:MAG: MraY family glycosyltransferase [Phycisphaerae bacterium]
MVWLSLISVAVAMAISLLATPGVRGWARARGFLDRPGGYKQHGRAVALGGGIAVVAALFAPILAALVGAWVLHQVAVPGTLVGLAERLVGQGRFYPLLGGLAGKTGACLGLLAGAAVLHVLGLIDDHRPLGAGVKLAVQTAVAASLVVGLQIRAAEFLGPQFASIVTIVWLVVIINAINFLDHTDGLAAGVGIIAAAILAVTAIRSGQVFVPVLSWMLVGALAGFLPYNFPPASIFLGDAGSLVVGYVLGVLTVLTTYYDPALQRQPSGFFLPLVVLAVPLYDTAAVMWQRRRSGASLLAGDRRHFSHRLVARGMQPRAAVLTIWLATAATALPAALLPQAGWAAAELIFTQCLCVLLIIAVLEHW